MYEGQIKRFQEEDKLNFPAADINLFVGSSSIRRWETIKENMYPKPVLLRGFGGSDMKTLLILYDKLIQPYKFSKIFIYEGDNDLNSKKRTPQSVLELFMQIVEKIHLQCSNAQINFISIKCSPARIRFKDKYDNANGLFKEYCKTQYFLNYIDIASKMIDSNGFPNIELFDRKDKIHPSIEGYKIMTTIIKPYLYPSDID